MEDKSIMVIESDLIIAYFKKSDWLKQTAEHIFDKIEQGELKNIILPTEVFHELYYVFRDYVDISTIQKIEAYLISFKNLKLVTVSAETYLSALTIMNLYNVTSIFDAIYAAVALSPENPDYTILSTDRVYDKIENLIRIDPRDI